MLDKIKITINGEELDLDEVVELNDGEPLEVIDILDKGTKNDFMKVHGAVMKAIR